MEIRPIAAHEIPQWCDLSRRTFYETFIPTNSEANTMMYIETHFTPEKLAQELADPRRMIYMGWIESQPAGYLNMFDGPVEPCVQSTRPIELARIYVDQAWHGKGLSKALMERAFEVARERNKNGIWLGVWEKNHRALAFYEKCGFKKVGDHIF